MFSQFNPNVLFCYFQGGYRNDERPPIEAFFKKDMLIDPWEGLQPYLMEKTSFTTT